MVWGGVRLGRGLNLPFLSLQPAKHILFYKDFSKMSPSAFSILGPPGPGGAGAGVKPVPKHSLDRWGSVCKISSRSVQGFGIPLALHIPTNRQTDRQTSVRPFLYI